MRHGCDLPLPPEIEAGVGEVARRGEWNKPAPAEYALPTEIWREVVARRQRCQEVRTRLAAGEVTEINDLITLNLDIRQFAQDVIEALPTPEALRAFTKAITTIRVLDPTVGSGAFLFAALNVLEPLLEACLDRMAAFVEEKDAGAAKPNPEKYKDFRAYLAQIAQHPNRCYFILKTIMIFNLYGVDIMDEAVEICKLRLFLKLVAQVEQAGQVEPLPDIDFNIRPGNTLVGYARADEVRQAFQTGEQGGVKMQKLFLMDEEQARWQRFEERLQDVERLFNQFRLQQARLGGEVTAADKQALRQRLDALAGELDTSLAAQYGVDPADAQAFARWRASHRPFHWLVEFYGVIRAGGFDVIIGNPPYVEYRKVQNQYTIHSYATESCADLYAFVMERSIKMLATHGRFGMIIPVSSVSTDGFQDLRKYLVSATVSSWISNFAERPSKLFSGVEKRLTIWIAKKGQSSQHHACVSKYIRWFMEERPILFFLLSYVSAGEGGNGLVPNTIPKVNKQIELSIVRRMFSQKPLAMFFVEHSGNKIFYTRKLRYFVQFFNFVPRITNSQGEVIPPSELKDVCFSTITQRDIGLALLNSSLYFWYLSIYSDVRNVNRRELLSFRCSIDQINVNIATELTRLASNLMADFEANSRELTNDYKQYGVLRIQSFQPRLSKPIIDIIDGVLALHYGFTDEELDFIINYDIKYRMGGELEGDPEE